MARIIGVIGGTGLDSFEGFQADKKTVETPYGSIDLKVGELLGSTIVFVHRHGREGEYVVPHLVNYKGNIAALKMEGCTEIVAFSSVGSMRRNIHPGSIFLPNGWLLYNVNRPEQDTFFGYPGVVVHVVPEPPMCPVMRKGLAKATGRSGYAVNDISKTGLYLNIQGPEFLTAPESHALARVYRELSVIGMCAYPEGKLARTAEMCYDLVALVTDYNHLKGMPHVTDDAVREMAEKNKVKAREVLENYVKIKPAGKCRCRHALRGAVAHLPRSIGDAFVDSLLSRYRKAA